MSKNLSGIINWLKGWFYDKSEVDSALLNKIDKASSDTGFVKSNGDIVDFGNTATTVAKGNHTHNNLAITRNLTSGEDLDALTTTGWYYASGVKYTNFVNAPTPTTSYSYFLIYVQRGAGNTWTQTLYTFPNGTNKSEIFYRKKHGSSAWTVWSKIATIDDIPTSLAASQITGLSNVATSGSYNDLSDKPSSFTPSSHAHGEITNAGTIGSTANLPIITTTSGKLTTGSFGTAENTFCQGNDTRLSDTRTPTFNYIDASSTIPKDLNDYKTGGFYYTNHDTNKARYISHCPNSMTGSAPFTNNKSFFLLVESWGETNNQYVKQTLTYHNDNKTYTRTCSNGTWKDWVEISKDTDTTYSAEKGITLSSGKFGHSNTAITAGTNYDSNQSPSFNSTFNIPKLTYDAYGHIIASANSTVKIPALPTASTSQAGIIQIGTGASNAAAGNHEHDTLNVQSITATSGDALSNYTAAGWYKLINVSNFTDAPEMVTYGYLENKNYSEKTFVQVVYTLVKNTVTNIYYRQKYSGGNFTAWTKLNYTHPTNTELSTESIYSIKTDSGGHVISATSIGVDYTNGGTQYSSDLITSGAVYEGLSAKSQNGHTHSVEELTDYESLSSWTKTNLGSTGKIWFNKDLQIVFIRVSQSYSFNSTNWFTFLSHNTYSKLYEYRPKLAINLPVAVIGSDDAKIESYINTDGDILLKSSALNSHEFILSGMYPFKAMG